MMPQAKQATADDQQESQQPLKKGDEETIVTSTARNGWERFLDGIRLATPDVIVNEGGRFNFAFRAAADAMSIKSGLRPAILNNEELHRPYFELNPDKLPKGYSKFEKGMHLGYASPHRAIGGAITLGALLLGAYYGEKPVSEEERQAQKEMPVGKFIKKRLRDSLHPSQHATATAGMATIANGAMIATAGMKQFSGFIDPRTKRFSLKMLPLETGQGLLTMLAGGLLQFIPNQEYAWQLSTTVFLNRIPLAAGQAWTAWSTGRAGKVDQGDWEQGAKFALNQTSNVFSMLYSGIKKENGQIIRVKKSDSVEDIGIITSDASVTNLDIETTPESPKPTINSSDAIAERVEEIVSQKAAS